MLAMQEYSDDEIGGLEYNAGGGGGEWIEEGSLDCDDDDGEEEEEEGKGEIVVEEGVQLLRDVENDTYVDGLLDEYMQEKKDSLFMVGTGMRRGGGSGFTALVGGKLRMAEELEGAIEEAEDEVEGVGEVLKEADEILSKPKERPPEEDVRIDGMSYFDDKVQNPWDCESVLSTYSNLDNRPKEIGNSRRRKKKIRGKELIKAGLEGVEEEVGERFEKIQLSGKTGLPINIQGQDDFEDSMGQGEGGGGENKGEGRKKGESKEEKKARKQKVKEERGIRRMEKQINRKGFTEEIGKRTKGKEQVLAGAAVFRYS